MHVTGTFDVTTTPQPQQGPAEEAGIGRRALDKRFHGDLDATSKGEMISIFTEATGAAAYVALERVTGTIGGHTGTFALMHAGTMHAGTQALDLRVVPGSGTGGLAGIDGKMGIRIVDKQHFYDFDYTLPAQ